LLLKGYELVQKEPGTHDWFAVRYTTIENQYAVLDTFASVSERDAHMTTLKANAPTLLRDNPEFFDLDIVARVLKTADIKDLKVGRRVFVIAKQGKEQEMRQFLEVRFK
jgi:quinol monooxygenase YgiN